MWQTWKQRLPYSLPFVLFCIGVFYFVAGVRDPVRLAIVFVFLMSMTLYGAWMGTRMQQRMGKRAGDQSDEATQRRSDEGR
jgi:uncharacterized RDD family membrane protein YckC